jgi:hypothetical protein
MKGNTKDKPFLFLKGAANVIPGGSGGTGASEKIPMVSGPAVSPDFQ